MITITLNKIKAHTPCEPAFSYLVKARGGDSDDWDQEFPVVEIFNSNSLENVLWGLRCLPEYDDLWRLYAVWCARQIEHKMEDERSIKALDVAEAYAKGQATQKELDSAWGAARDAAIAAVGNAAKASKRDAARAAAWTVAENAGRAAAWVAAQIAAEEEQKAKLIEILNAGKWV